MFADRYPRPQFSSIQSRHSKYIHITHIPLNLAHPAAPPLCSCPFVAPASFSAAPNPPYPLPSSATLPLTSLLLPMPRPNSAPRPAYPAWRSYPVEFDTCLPSFHCSLVIDLTCS